MPRITRSRRAKHAGYSRYFAEWLQSRGCYCSVCTVLYCNVLYCTLRFSSVQFSSFQASFQRNITLCILPTQPLARDERLRFSVDKPGFGRRADRPPRAPRISFSDDAKKSCYFVFRRAADSTHKAAGECALGIPRANHPAQAVRPFTEFTAFRTYCCINLSSNQCIKSSSVQHLNGQRRGLLVTSNL